MLLLAASEFIEGPNETKTKGKLGRINDPWIFPLCRLVQALIDLWGLSAIPMIKSNSKWGMEKCHLTLQVEAVTALSMHLTTFQSPLINVSPKTFRRCLVKLLRSRSRWFHIQNNLPKFSKCTYSDSASCGSAEQNTSSAGNRTCVGII